MKKSVKITIVCAIIAVIIAASAIVGVSLYRDSPNYQLSLAERYMSEMNYEQAIITLEKYLEIEPNDAEAWLMLADAYYKLGDLDKAIDALERGLSHVDDERLHTKLEEYLREKNPPVTTVAETTTVTTTVTTTTTTAETEPPVNEAYIDYAIIEPNVESVYSRSNGLFVTTKDDLYAFTDLYGNLKSGYDYVKVFYSYGNENEQYCVAQKSENQYLLVNGNYNMVLDMGKPDNWYFFNKEEPLIAVTYSGKSYWLSNQSTGEFTEYDDSKNAYLQIYRCKDGKLLYNWSNGDWIDGKGTQGSLNDSRMSFQYPDKTVKINDIYFTFYGFDVSIYGSGIGTEGDCLSWVFNIDPQYYVSDWTEQYNKWASDEYDKQVAAQQALANGQSYYLIGTAHNYSGFSNNVSLPVKAEYNNGAISIVAGNGKSISETDTYSIHDIHLLPTPMSEYMLSMNGTNTYMAIGDGYNESRFGWATNNIYKDTVICGRQSADNPDNVDIAFFKPIWYSTREKASEMLTTEWSPISDWIKDIKYIYSLGDELFCLSRVSPEDSEKTQEALFVLNATGQFEALTDWYESIYWNQTDDPLFGAKRNGVYCFIDRSGKIYGEYEDVTSFMNGIAIVKENGKAYFINEDFEKISEEFDSDSAWAVADNIFGINTSETTKYIVVGDYNEKVVNDDTTTVIVTTPAITTPYVQTNVPDYYDEYYESYSMSRDKSEPQPLTTTATTTKKAETTTRKTTTTKKTKATEAEITETSASDADTTSTVKYDEAEVETMLLNYIQGNGTLNKEYLSGISYLEIAGTTAVKVSYDNWIWDALDAEPYSAFNSDGASWDFCLNNDRNKGYSSGNLNDISFLSSCINLKRLSISYNEVQDIAVIKKLSNLESLSLRHNRIKDVSPLANLTNLDHLVLMENDITDISSLSKLAKIAHLEVGYNQIADISVVNNYPDLNTLTVSNNKISDISALKSLSKIEWLDLSYNAITDISALSGKKSLKYLFLWGNSIENSKIEKLKDELPDCSIF